jgi:hypothetical protein
MNIYSFVKVLVVVLIVPGQIFEASTLVHAQEPLHLQRPTFRTTA